MLSGIVLSSLMLYFPDDLLVIRTAKIGWGDGPRFLDYN
jgi:hypothetical protein